MDSLRKQLNHCLEKKIPVIMTVAVMGTTEEGSIDPLTDMLMMRNEFKKKGKKQFWKESHHDNKYCHTFLGLNFCMHADAAWGGYICTMIEKTESTGNSLMRRGTIMRRGSKYRTNLNADYVPTSPLNEHSKVMIFTIHKHVDLIKMYPIIGEP